MIKGYFEYDETLVCNECEDNNGLHFNFHVFHESEWANADPDIPVWCSNCDMEPKLIDPDELEGNDNE